jgi:hypothetical protein
MVRDDLSDKLIHLVKGNSYDEVVSTFTKILNERRLLGGTGCIRGGYRCVCFSEAPISKLGIILANPDVHGMRYRGFGIMVEKIWLFKCGGRPVIYQPDSEFDLLPESHRFRHVRYEPDTGVDFSWEREWRIRTDELSIRPDDVTAIVPNRDWIYGALREHTRVLADRARRTGGSIGAESTAVFPWHFIALGDLGVPVPEF